MFEKQKPIEKKKKNSISEKLAQVFHLLSSIFVNQSVVKKTNNYIQNQQQQKQDAMIHSAVKS